MAANYEPPSNEHRRHKRTSHALTMNQWERKHSYWIMYCANNELFRNSDIQCCQCVFTFLSDFIFYHIKNSTVLFNCSYYYLFYGTRTYAYLRFTVYAFMAVERWKNGSPARCIDIVVVFILMGRKTCRASQWMKYTRMWCAHWKKNSVRVSSHSLLRPNARTFDPRRERNLTFLRYEFEWMFFPLYQRTKISSKCFPSDCIQNSAVAPQTNEPHEKIRAKYSYINNIYMCANVLIEKKAVMNKNVCERCVSSKHACQLTTNWASNSYIKTRAHKYGECTTYEIKRVPPSILWYYVIATHAMYMREWTMNPCENSQIHLHTNAILKIFILHDAWVW